MSKLSIGSNLHPPPIARLFPINASNTATVIASRGHLVLHIFRMSHIPKISQPVVRWVSVNMINFITRPVSINPKPSKPMGEIHTSKYTDIRPVVTFFRRSSVSASCNRPDRRSVALLDSPCKYPGVWRVLQNIADLLRTYNRSAHSVASYWQLLRSDAHAACRLHARCAIIGA
jgi:hypothetical protein